MQIRCPHCGNVFESTGITPFCPNCGQRVDPSADASEPGSASAVEEPNPWERRGEVGLLAGYWETWKSIMFSPDKFWERARPEGSLWDALAFSWIATAVSTLLSLPLQLLQGAGQMQQALDRMNDLPPGLRETLASFAGGGIQVGFALGGLLLFPVVFFIAAGIVHLFCMLFGQAQNGFTATTRAVGYATAPTLLSWIPCVNVFLMVYVMVLVVWGLARLQRTTYGRAAAAVLTPAVLVCCCGCAVLIRATMALTAAAGQ
jgi:hypothetical protein